jgi:hypothetical protein
MTTINLSQSSQQKINAQKVEPVDKGVYISIAILVVTLLVFGGLKTGTTVMASKQKNVNDQINAESSNLANQEVERVSDFTERLNKIDQNIAAKKDPDEILRQVGQGIVQGAMVNSFENTPDSLVLKVSADNFQTAAKQVLSFKKISYFKSVKVNEISRDTDGRILVTMEISL